MEFLAPLEWPHWVLLSIATLFLACFAYARANARGSAKAPIRFQLEDHPGSKELIVITHAFRGSALTMEPVTAAIRETRPEADLLVFEFPSQVFSNANPISLAAQIDDQIDSLYQDRRYDRILMCGYSIGALLVRKAYVYGRGSIADAPHSGGRHVVERAAREWTDRVTRFILLAGMNRGWSRESKLPQSSPLKRLAERFAYRMAKLSRTGLLLRHCEKGEPFVANLRLQWLEEMRNLADESKPTVIQLLGDRDDVVSPEDSKDVSVSKDFVWVSINNTGHGDMANLGDEGTALERKHKLRMAFGDDETIERLKQYCPVPKLFEDPNVRSVVFVLHGIRDMGDWTSQFEQPLQDAYRLNAPTGASKLYVHRALYSYFGMGPFLLWSDRQKNVRWFMDQVTEVTAQFPNLEEMHFIGHSNGTYILASALEKYATLRISRAALAGSVIRRDFPWSEYDGRISKVRNYVGASDWVVGLLPRVFELPVFCKINRDIGSAGFNGFVDGFATPMETKFVKGAHGAALHKDNIPSIVAFIISGTKIEADNLILNPGQRSKWLVALSNMCWVLWTTAALALAWSFYKIPVLAKWIMPENALSPDAIDWGARGGLLLLLGLILYTL